MASTSADQPLRILRRPGAASSQNSWEDHSSPSSSSSEEEEDDSGDDQLDEEEEAQAAAEEAAGEGEEDEDDEVAEKKKDKRKKGRTIIISLKRVCKVCKEPGHEAGFQGATYIDCPKKPCFLCKMPGHTTMSCPHRVAMEHGVIPAAVRNTKTPLDYVFMRQLKAKVPKIKPALPIPDQVDRGLIGIHSRRVTYLEFHPTNNNLLLSGDKKGQLAIWDYVKLHDQTVYGSIHSCIVNNIKFKPGNDAMIYTSSSDGTVSCTDIETGIPNVLMDLNPDGWNGSATWRMLYGMDINSEKGVLLLGDNFGYLHLIDVRSKMRTGEPVLAHKKGSKIVGLHCNPAQPDMLLSCGNDHFARIWDVRQLNADPPLARLAHGRVVNSAYFSPLTGNKILTTSQDNRIRVWDSIFGNLEIPSREIVHSHDFNRHLTPFRAEWDPKDPSESLVVIGRYISENYNGVALHPIDFIDTSTGKLVAEVTDVNITTITPVNKLHPRENILASGSSRSLFIWKPKQDEEELKRRKEFAFGKYEKKSQGKKDDDKDDDFDAGTKGKSYKSTTRYVLKSTTKTGKSKVA